MISHKPNNVILILANNDVGLYKFRRELIIELLKKYEVHLSLPYGNYIEELCQMGCIFHETDLNRRGLNPFEDLKLMWRYNSLIKQISPNCILTYTIKPNIYGGLISSFNKTKYFANITGLGSAIESKSIISKILIWMYGISLKKSSCIFFQNLDNQQYMNKKLKINAPQVLLKGSGINLISYPLLPYPIIKEGYLNIIFIGRIMRDKGIDEFLKVAETVHESSGKINFHIIGSMEENYTEKIKEMVEKGSIYYHGEQESITPFLKMAHALFHPSYHEGMSNVILEAAASGRPVLASNISGCKEIIQDGITGFLFERADVSDMLKQLNKFSALPFEKKIQMGLAGRKYVEENFDRQEVIKKYMEKIED